MEAIAINETDQFRYFPGSRYMGSKNKIIGEIWDVLSNIEFVSFFDAFAGSNVVSYYMKCMGKQVYTNDFMALSYVNSKAIIENGKELLSENESAFLIKNKNNYSFIQDTFNGIFFDEKENAFLDRVRYNIDLLDEGYSKYIALSALARACTKKQSRGIFTFVGERYNDGRADMQKSIEQHFMEGIILINQAVFNNGKKCKSYNKRTEASNVSADLVYFDPPYYSPKSDNDYTRRYHFVEGLVKNWEGIQIQEHTMTKKFESYKTPFSKRENAYEAFDVLFSKYKKSTIVVSYSSNSLPTKEELAEILRKYKSNVVIHEIDHRYSFGNQNHKIGNNANLVKEYLFVGL